MHRIIPQCLVQSSAGRNVPVKSQQELVGDFPSGRFPSSKYNRIIIMLDIPKHRGYNCNH